MSENTIKSSDVDVERLQNELDILKHRIVNESRRERAIFNILDDIREKEAALKESERRYRSYIDQSADGVCSCTKNGEITFLNPVAQKVFEKSSENPVGKSIFSFFQNNERACTKEDFLRCASSNAEHVLQLKSDPERFFDIRVIDIDNENLLVTFRDITSRIRSQQHIEELNELRNRFIQIVSHQLRTPLNAIRWNLESILRGDLGNLPEAQRVFLRVTYQANLSVINRIRDLLTVMDIEEGRVSIKREMTSLTSLIQSVVTDLHGFIEAKEISLEEKIAEDVPSLSIDSMRIHNVLEALVQNAIDYTPEKGHVSVSVVLKGNRVRCEVADNGIGIPEADKSRVFMKFFRATNASTAKTDSSGLGLAIASFFVKAHGGTMGFESTEGKGSTFWFELPINNNIGGI